MIDLDHFKKINDTYGHDCGDYVLKEVANAIQDSIRLEDVFGRYGGEEFMIILPFTRCQDAAKQADRIRKKISSLELTWNDEIIRITVSIGVAGLPDDPVESEEELLKIADFRLYKAKEKGRNTVEYLEPAEKILTKSDI